jgi:hypothetical protein
VEAQKSGSQASGGGVEVKPHSGSTEGFMQVVSRSEYDRFHRSNVVISESGQPEIPEEWDFEPEINFDYDDDDAAQMAHTLIGVTPSHFTEFAVKVPNKKLQKHVPFSFTGREYLRLPYDTPSRRTLYKCGRQVEKSTLLGNKCLSYSCIINAFQVLYVSPTNAQTKTFSQDRLREPVETSDILKAWTTTKLSDNVFLKKFINRSQITLRYAYHNADRTRGIPADLILIDELQDIITDNIPVIEECASHSEFKYFHYSGTPKTLDNAIEHYWTNLSTQNEWVVPCELCGVQGRPETWHWNVLSEENIGVDGLICDKCKRPIYATHPEAQWVCTNPSVKERLAEPYEGFRIPQLMVPWLSWSEIYDKYVKYPRAQFYNEVLGESYDSGTRPLTRQDVIDNCQPGMLMTPSYLSALHKKLGQGTPIFCGIDWGTGEGSYTLLTLAAYIEGKFTVFYAHRFEGQETEPPVQLEIIEQIIKNWNVSLVGVDYGGGFDRNDHLTRKFGTKIVKYQYSQPGQKVKWEEKLRRFLVHRTEVMSDIFNAIKRRNIFRFPDWSAWEDPFAKDMLNIFSEYNEQLRQVQYKKSPDATDDTFHAILLCFLASLLKVQNYEVLNPTSKTGITILDEV